MVRRALANSMISDVVWAPFERLVEVGRTGRVVPDYVDTWTQDHIACTGSFPGFVASVYVCQNRCNIMWSAFIASQIKRAAECDPWNGKGGSNTVVDASCLSALSSSSNASAIFYYWLNDKSASYLLLRTIKFCSFRRGRLCWLW